MAFLRLGWTQHVTRTEADMEGQPLSLMEFESPSAAVIALPVPIIARYSILWVSLLVLSIVLFCTFAPLDIVITASGKIVSTAATVVMQPFDQSIIKSIDVRTGEIVHKGQLLTTLDPTLTQADTDAYTKAVAQLGPELDRLYAERDGKTYVPKDATDPNQAVQLKLFEQRHAQVVATGVNWNQQIASLEQQISGNLAAAEYYRQRLGMATDVESLRRQEEQLQVGSKLNSLEAADARVQMEAGMQQAIASAQSEKSTLQSDVGQRDEAIAEFNAATAQSISDTGALLVTAQQNLQKAGLHGGLVEMRAPSDAVVLQVEKLSVGSVLQAGEQFIQLSPLDKPLQVETYISGTDIGWVLPGDWMEIKFDTFPYAQYGDADGHVLNVSVDSFDTPSAGNNNGPIITSTGTGDPGNAVTQAVSMSPVVSVFYIAEGTIDKLNLRNIPKDFRLVPGMPVDADIKVGTRTYMNYIFSRVAPVFKEAMREP